jgi:hypothetical protein
LIGPSNYDAVAREFGGVLQVSMTPLGAIPLSFASPNTQAAPVQVTGGQLSSWIGALTRQQLSQPASSAASAVNQPCAVSGSLSFTWTDTDGNLIFGIGDSIHVEARSCKWNPQLPALVGSLSFTVLGLDLAAGIGAITLRGFDFQLTLNGFGFSGAATTSGSARMRAQDLSGAMPTERITYSNVTVNMPGQPTTVNNLDLLMRTPVGRTEREINGSYARPDVLTLQQVSPFVETGTPYPTTGQLRIKDAQNASVLLKARSDQQVDVEYYPPGATQPSLVKTMSWAELLGG